MRCLAAAAVGERVPVGVPVPVPVRVPVPGPVPVSVGAPGPWPVRATVGIPAARTDPGYLPGGHARLAAPAFASGPYPLLVLLLATVALVLGVWGLNAWRGGRADRAALVERLAGGAGRPRSAPPSPASTGGCAATPGAAGSKRNSPRPGRP